MTPGVSGRGLILILSCCWRYLGVSYGLEHMPIADPAPYIMLLSPVNGEVFSALPIVLSYRIIGVDIVEVLSIISLMRPRPTP